MNRVTRLSAVLVLTACAPFVAHAASAPEPDSVATIRELVEQGQYDVAYEHALAAEARYEGDPEFDFYYGLAALESGYYPEAIFALERVVLAQPGQLRVRLELGRAHFLAGNYPAATAEFERVREQDPPPGVVANIDRFMERIDAAQRAQRRDIAAWVDAKLGVDSNINSATDANTIATPLGNFDLVADGQEQDDEFIRYEFGARIREPLDRDSALDASLRWQQKDNFGSDTFDLGLGTLEAGYTRNVENGRWRVGARLQHVRLDGDRFQDGYGLVGSYDRNLAKDLVLSLSGAATILRFDGQSGRDVNQYLTSATLVRPRGNWLHSLSLYGALEPARNNAGEFNGRDFGGIVYAVSVDAAGYQPYFRLGFQAAQHEDRHPVFARIREDKTTTAAAGVRWQLGDAFQITGELNYTNVDSNLPVFDFDRTLVELGLRRAF